MAPQTVYLPDGQTLTVTPVFAGLFFKANALNTHPSAFPVGWTVVLHTEDVGDDEKEPRKPVDERGDGGGGDEIEGSGGITGSGPGTGSDTGMTHASRRSHIHSFTRPTLQSDHIFISSISNPSPSEFKPAASPTRQLAMMLWVTLYWYFHQPPPSTVLPATAVSRRTPEEGRPRGDWRINIKCDGVLRQRNLISKLERMGLIASSDSSVGTSLETGGPGWNGMYVSQRMFWQIPGRLFLFSPQPMAKAMSSSGGNSPTSSRPGSPDRGESPNRWEPQMAGTGRAEIYPPTSPFAYPFSTPSPLPNLPSVPIGPFFSTSHLPTYYPPPPLQYTMTSGVRHPVRPKPPRMGEVFYNRFIPSAGQYLSFRVASVSPDPVPYHGPIGPHPPEQAPYLLTLSDTTLMQMWMGNPRVARFWGGYVPGFLESALMSRHSFPAIALWDGVPFAYFEIYWVREDVLGRHLGGGGGGGRVDIGDWDRGFHVFVGEEWARGRVSGWLTSLMHWALSEDMRTMSLWLEPRIDNTIFHQHLLVAGFVKETEVTFSHKQSWAVRFRRENWKGPTF